MQTFRMRNYGENGWGIEEQEISEKDVFIVPQKLLSFTDNYSNTQGAVASDVDVTAFFVWSILVKCYKDVARMSALSYNVDVVVC